MGAIWCPWQTVSIQSAQKPYAAFPLPYVLYMKCDHNWPTDFIEIYFFENVNRQQRQIIIYIFITISRLSLWLENVTKN